MEIISDIIGNIYHDKEWSHRVHDLEKETIYLDQWTAQKSRFLAKSDKGNEYPIALRRHTQIKSGDIISYSPEDNKIVVFQLDISPVLIIDMSQLLEKDKENLMRTSIELGHAIGNQHWPAVVKGTRIFVPLTVDKKVMLSVMDTHHIEGIKYEFQKGTEVIPYLAPNEIRRLFGGAAQESQSIENKQHHHRHEHQYTSNA